MDAVNGNTILDFLLAGQSGIRELAHTSYNAGTNVLDITGRSIQKLKEEDSWPPNAHL